MKYLLLFFSITFQGQVLHHQMISSQGHTAQTPDGLIIKQTIGQQSLAGTNGSDYIVMQGFQQSQWGKYIASSKIEEASGISVTTYPNPFTETVNFQFSEAVTDVVSISIFDVSGRLVYRQERIPISTMLTITLLNLPSTTYLVQLRTPKFNYYTQILKK